MDKNKTAIYVDFDECLIHGFTANDNKQPTFDEVKKQFETAWIPDDKDMYAIVLRPGAREFLKALQKITPNVFILTAGMKDFQTRVATAIGLIGLVKGLYGRDSKDVPVFPISVLIDDMWIKSPNTFNKSKQMGIISDEIMQKIDRGTRGGAVWTYEDEQEVADTIAKHYIQIGHFDATDPNDKGFDRVLPQIKPKLGALEKEVNAVLKEKIVKTFKKRKVSNI